MPVTYFEKLMRVAGGRYVYFRSDPAVPASSTTTPPPPPEESPRGGSRSPGRDHTAKNGATGSAELAQLAQRVLRPFKIPGSGASIRVGANQTVD